MSANSQAKNENLLREFAEGCEGTYGTLEEAIAELDTPRIKAVNPMPSFKGMLRLGDSQKYETAVQIPVERYPRTYVARPPSASSFVPVSKATQDEEGDPKPSQGDALTAVRVARTYQVDDPSAVGGKVDVERDDLAKGYEYGRTAVHISQIDENITRLDTFACLDLIGFINQDKVRHHNSIGTST
jgi:ATP-dependent DNA helicase 2 subunit 2